MVKVCEVPGQPLLVGVTVIVETTGVVPVLDAVNEAMSPVPLAPNPVVVLSLVQSYVVPATAPAKLTAVVDALAQTL